MLDYIDNADPQQAMTAAAIAFVVVLAWEWVCWRKWDRTLRGRRER